jgi:DNA-binding GntR family transcriptional regulator
MKLSKFISDVKTPGLPKYAQLREAVLQAVAEGALKPGEQLPPDLEIVRDTRLSLGTVQSAMRALAKEGAIVRDQGRGTFVAENQKRQLEKPWYACFSREGDAKTPLPVFVKLISCERVSGQERLVRLLNSKTDDFIQIERLITIGDELCIYDQFFLNAAQFEGFLSKTAEELERTNFKLILRREYNVNVGRLARSTRLTNLPEEVCRKIGVPPMTIGLIQQSIAYSEKGNPLFLQENYIPPHNLIHHFPAEWGIPMDWA